MNAKHFIAPSFMAWLLLFLSILVSIVAFAFIPGPWEIEIWRSTGGFDWTKAMIYTSIGVLLIGVASFIFYAFLTVRKVGR